MEFKTKLILDRILGRFLCFKFGLLALFLGKILNRNHSMDYDKVKVIVIAKYFGIGSITHCIPMIKALKNKYPNAKFCFITREKNREFLTLLADIDYRCFVNDNSLMSFIISNIKTLFSLWRLKIDLFFDLEVFSSYGALLALFSLTRNRLGFFFPHSAIFKSWIYTHLMYFNFRMPIRLAYMQLARLAGADENYPIDLLPFNLSQETLMSAKDKLEKLILNNGSKILLVNANASELSFARRWKIENFAKTAIHFAKLGYSILFLGAPNEREYIQEALVFIDKNYGNIENIYNVAGQFSLQEVIALFNLADCLLTNDSGLMNLGYAQGIKTVALYGANNPNCVHIDNGFNIVIYKQPYCSPCVHVFDSPPCGNYVVCMDSINVEEVIKAVEKIFNEQSHDIKPTVIENIISQNSDYIMGALRIR